jgi:hypothetical protein
LSNGDQNIFEKKKKKSKMVTVVGTSQAHGMHVMRD